MTDYQRFKNGLKYHKYTINEKHDITVHAVTSGNDEEGTCDLETDLNFKYNPKTETFTVDSPLICTDDLDVAQALDLVEHVDS